MAAPLQPSERELILQGTRRDGRSADESRPSVLNLSSLRHADGSAVARFGQTTVICGVKAELAKPRAETPNEGYLVLNVELGPLCSPDQTNAQPGDDAQLVTALVERSILETKTVDLKDLCIVPDQVVWVLYVDVICLNMDGGVIGAAVCAAGAALHDTRLPIVKVDTDTGVKTVLDETAKLPVHATPTAVSFAAFDSVLLQDPTAEEESLSDGQLTVVVCPEKPTSVPLCLPGARCIKPAQVTACISAAHERAKHLSKLLSVAQDNPDR